MGVKNLWDVVESCKKTLPLTHLQNKTVCIDLSCWMVQLQKVNRSHCALKEKLYLKGLFHRLRALIALNCRVIFVTDGAIPAVKISTYRRRLNSVNEEVTRDDVDKHKIASLPRNMGSDFSRMIREAKILGLALGIPCLDGIEEAEAQCALLNSELLCDGCFTSDSDVFLFGARTVYRDICLEKGGYVVCYEMADIEKKLGLGRHSLIALALLLGSDYSDGVRGFGPDSACQVIRSIGEEVVLQRIASDGISLLKSLKTSKKHGQFARSSGKENSSDHLVKATDHQHLERDNKTLQVIDAYMKPKCHSGDSDPVCRVLCNYPFQCSELQRICSQLFGWPPEKTDEYILPRIAERELRRFAKFRSYSSQLGAELPLHKMVIKCPISELLKHRRVQGRECFEVSWKEFDGLKTSIVPADLVECACPEKIAEFEERRAQKKKQNRRKPRSKKSEDTISMANVDAKLQSLLLDIEAEDNARCKPPLCSSTSTSRSSIEIDLTISDTFLNEHCESNISNKPIINCQSDHPSSIKMDVIDLLSPSPEIRTRCVSKCEGNAEQISVIDLSDSDVEISTEHSRKAKELRLFLASIREEIS